MTDTETDKVKSVVFCPHCHNVLSPGKQDNDLIYSCRLCNYVEKAKVENYRISYISTEQRHRVAEKYENVIVDNTVPRAKKKCPTTGCNANYLIFTVEPQTLRKTYYCEECKSVI